MGIVVAATHLDLDQRVAIKFLLPEALRNRIAVERFLREARVAAKVRSEYVARVHDVGTLDGDVPYIVMEYLEGSDLGQLIDTHGPRPIDEACEIALQACEALAEVHAAGIVHRDLKPSNLFVTRHADGSPAAKLLDFGISKLTFGDEDATVDPGLTTTATIMGSPSYMSPEQLKSTKEVDSRADVWSLGAVLYEATTGRPAFRGESVPQVCALIASEDPPPPSGLRAGLPAELQTAILACLEKDPDKRITLVALATTLARFAPARAKPSLDRIVATLGAQLPPLPVPPLSGRPGGLPVLPLASLDRSRTAAAWGRDRGRGGRRGVLLLGFVLGVAGLLGLGVYAGQVNVARLRVQVAGATSAVTSAAGAVSAAIASSLPGMPLPLGTVEQPSSADGGGPPDEDDAEPLAEPAPSSSVRGAAASSARPTPGKPHPAKPGRHPAKRRRSHLY
jgi:tRNA A-37 threonylcarbamoyl transferase component Bud32